MADPDLQIGGGGGGARGGAGAGHPDPEIRGGGPGLQNIFFALRASVWSKNKGGGGLAPSPGSATEHRFELCYADFKGFQETAPKPHPRHCMDAEMTYYVHSPWDLTRLTQ